MVYQENWSFDGLYGTFPNADGLKNAAATIPQVDRLGHHISLVPDFSLEPNVPAGLPIKPFDLAQYIDLTAENSDLKHAFYTEQLQIDNGNVEPSNGVMDKFVAWTDNPSLVMSYYNAPPGRGQARREVLALRPLLPRRGFWRFVSESPAFRRRPTAALESAAARTGGVQVELHLKARQQGTNRQQPHVRRPVCHQYDLFRRRRRSRPTS